MDTRDNRKLKITTKLSEKYNDVDGVVLREA
jgi:hypothetical protein